jgi:Ca2+-binding EF-hand superfamily protein
MQNAPAIQESLSVGPNQDLIGTRRMIDSSDAQAAMNEQRRTMMPTSAGVEAKEETAAMPKARAKLDAAQERELRSAFKIFDKDGDGTIDME